MNRRVLLSIFFPGIDGGELSCCTGSQTQENVSSCPKISEEFWNSVAQQAASKKMKYQPPILQKPQSLGVALYL